MNEDTEPLVQFQAYYGSAAQKSLESESGYVQLREAFYAGYRARPQEPIAPSRDALSVRKDILRRYSPPQPSFRPGDGSADYLPAPDFIQHGTVTGRIPRPDGPITRENFMLQAGNAPRMDQREPVDYADKARRFHEVYGVEPAKVVAGPDPETLERIHDQLKAKGVVEYPAPVIDTAPVGLEHTETVWDGDTTMQFGARGPVPTALSLQEDENEAS